MDLDRGGAVQHRRAARALGLETGEQHRAARIGQVVLQMMDHAPAGGHAAGRHDDLGHGRAVQRLGLFHLGHIGRHAERRPRVGRRQALVTGVPKIDIDGAAGHRAVQEHRQVAGDAPRLLELPDVVEQRLRAPHRERGYHHGAAAPDRARDDGFQRVGRLLRAVLAVAIGGLDDQMIGLRHPARRRHQRIAVATQVAGKHQASAGMADLDDGGAQDMAGRGQLDAATARQVRGRVEVDRPQGRDRALRVGDGVQR